MTNSTPQSNAKPTLLEQLQARVERSAFENIMGYPTGTRVPDLINQIDMVVSRFPTLTQQLEAWDKVKEEIGRFQFDDPSLRDRLLARIGTEKASLQTLNNNSAVIREADATQPLGDNIIQGGYGSCQILAVVDDISRQPGGIDYLQSLVTSKPDGTYDVKLHGRDGTPMVMNVSPDTSYHLGHWANRDNSADGRITATSQSSSVLISDAPLLARVIEQAYVKFTYKNSSVDPEFAAAAIVQTTEQNTQKMSLDDYLAQPVDKPHTKILTLNIPDQDEATVHGFELRNKHAYQLTENSDGTVTLRNPWDTSLTLSISPEALKPLKPVVTVAYSDAFGAQLEQYTTQGAGQQVAATPQVPQPTSQPSTQQSQHMTQPTTPRTDPQPPTQLVAKPSAKTQDAQGDTNPKQGTKEADGSRLVRRDLEGKYSKDVEQLQKHLVSIGQLKPEDVDGLFGDTTATALYYVQAQMTDGKHPYPIKDMVADAATRRWLEAAAAKAEAAKGKPPSTPEAKDKKNPATPANKDSAMQKATEQVDEIFHAAVRAQVQGLESYTQLTLEPPTPVTFALKDKDDKAQPSLPS